MRAAAPAVPPGGGGSAPAKVPIDYARVLDGAYPGSGRCGPGCKAGPWISGSKAGGGGVGGLIHDQFVFQSTGGEELDKLWEQPAGVRRVWGVGARRRGVLVTGCSDLILSRLSMASSKGWQQIPLAG